MNIQKLEHCCSTAYLYAVGRSDYETATKERFATFLKSKNVLYEKHAILYICDCPEVYQRLKKLGFKYKCSYNGAYTSWASKPGILILDLRKFRKSLDALTFKQKIKNLIAKW